MKKTVVALALGVVVAAAGAEEPPHLDFVQKLRASHYPDLALEYLEKLAKNAPADLRPSIELERARAQLDLARAESDTAKKPALLAKAREGFEAFVKNNPNSAQASEAKLEITSLAVLQGKAQLQKAMRQSGAARRTEAAAARAALDDAAKQLEIGVKELDLKLVKYDDAKTPKELKEKKDLEDAKLRAMLDRGVILLEEVQTFSTTDDSSKERADVVKQARNVLEKTMAAADTHAPLHWQAQAWIAKAIHEDGDLPTSRARLEKIIKTAASSANTPGLDAGKRLATYFLMQVAPEVPQQKLDPIREQFDLGQTWIRTYSREIDTPEGQHVRFLLGEACVKLAQALRAEKN